MSVAAILDIKIRNMCVSQHRKLNIWKISTFFHINQNPGQYIVFTGLYKYI